MSLSRLTVAELRTEFRKIGAIQDQQMIRARVQELFFRLIELPEPKIEGLRRRAEMGHSLKEKSRKIDQAALKASGDVVQFLDEVLLAKRAKQELTQQKQHLDQKFEALRQGFEQQDREYQNRLQALKEPQPLDAQDLPTLERQLRAAKQRLNEKNKAAIAIMQIPDNKKALAARQMELDARLEVVRLELAIEKRQAAAAAGGAAAAAPAKKLTFDDFFKAMKDSLAKGKADDSVLHMLDDLSLESLRDLCNDGFKASRVNQERVEKGGDLSEIMLASVYQGVLQCIIGCIVSQLVIDHAQGTSDKNRKLAVADSDFEKLVAVVADFYPKLAANDLGAKLEQTVVYVIDLFFVKKDDVLIDEAVKKQRAQQAAAAAAGPFSAPEYLLTLQKAIASVYSNPQARQAKLDELMGDLRGLPLDALRKLEETAGRYASNKQRDALKDHSAKAQAQSNIASILLDLIIGVRAIKLKTGK